MTDAGCHAEGQVAQENPQAAPTSVQIGITAGLFGIPSTENDIVTAMVEDRMVSGGVRETNSYQSMLLGCDKHCHLKARRQGRFKFPDGLEHFTGCFTVFGRPGFEHCGFHKLQQAGQRAAADGQVKWAATWMK